MRYISVECEYFSAKFVPNPALLPELFLSEAMSIHSGGVDEQGKGQTPCNGHNEIGCKPSRNRGHNIFHPVLATWDICSGNWHIARDRTGLLA